MGRPIYLDRYEDMELVHLWGEIMEQLQRRGVVRSANNPIADIAERIVADIYGVVELAPSSQAGYDLVTPDGERVQVKALRRTQRSRNVLSAIRSEDFDVIVVVVFRADMRIDEILRFPRSVAAKHWSWNAHWNGWRLTLTRALRGDPDVEPVDLTRVTGP